MKTYSSILAWEIRQTGAWKATVHEVTNRHNWATDQLLLQQSTIFIASSVPWLSCKYLSLNAGRTGSAIAFLDINLMSDKEVMLNRKQQLFSVIVSLTSY